MKQVFKSFLWTVGFLSIYTSSHSQNLISNGGFESGATGWSSQTGGGGSATFGLSTTDKKEGTQSYQAVVSTLGANTWSIQTLGPTWNATLYQTYSITFWAKSSVAGAKLNLVQQNQNYSVNSVTLTTSWAQYQYDYVAFETAPQFKIQYLAVGSYLLDGISVAATTVAPPTGNELKTLAARCNLSFGAAVSDAALQNDADYINTLKKEFSMVVAENSMKMGSLKPTETGAYNFGAADRLVNFATANGMKVRGHTLVWHSQLPSWVETKTWTKASLLAYLKDYITTVVGRYKGKITEWDVANECIDDASGNPIRSSVWFDVIGEEVLDSAFKWTNQIDPNAKLFYNDYSAETMNGKSNAVYALVSRLKSRKAPIHGVGFQSHIGHTTASSMTTGWISQADQNIKRIGALGLQVAITELDLGIPVPFDAAKYAAQATSYGNILRLALNNPSIVKTFTLWGFTDKYSWIPGFSQGKNGAALILYDDYSPKPAYGELVNLLTANCPIPTNCTAKITASGATTFCTGGKVILTTNIGASYKWFKGTTQVATTASYTATTSGSYTVEVTYANGCKGLSAAIGVIVNPSSVATISSPTNSFCTGGNVTLTSSTGTSYVWRNGTSTVGTSSSYLAKTAGSYTVIVTNASGCKDTSAIKAITVNPSPIATISSPTNSFCTGGNVTLTSSTGTSYVWRNGTSTVGTSSSYVAKAAGSYTVIVTNASGCKDTSAVKTITENPLPVLTHNTRTDNVTWAQQQSFTACVGDNVYTGPWPNLATGWSWSGPNNFSSTLRNPILSSISSNQAGKYTATYTDPKGCSASLDLTIVVSIPTATISSPASSLCPGGNVVLTASIGTGYVWRNASIVVGTTATYTAKTAGNYTVVVSNANGCKDTSIVKTITVNPVPVVSITSPANNAVLTTNIFPINATVTGTNISNVSFYNGTSLIGADATSPFSFTTPSLINGTYTFSAIAKNTSNCTDTAKVTVKVNKVVTYLETADDLSSNIHSYPNPFQECIKIEASGSFSYIFYNTAGFEVEKGVGNGDMVVGESLPEGLYILKVKSDAAEKTVKVNKMR